MQEKIEEQLDLDTDLRKINDSMDYVNKIKKSNEYVGSLARFPSIYFELINIQHDPILGYGRNNGKSYFSQRISGNFALTGGIKIIGQFGIPLAILLFIILYRSSAALGREFKVRKIALFAIFLVFLVSYGFFTVPVFMAFWFYGIFRKEEDLVLILSENSTETTTETSSETPTPSNESVLPS